MHDIQVYDAATQQQIQQEAVHYPTETDGQHETEDMDENWELPPGENSRIADVKVTCYLVDRFQQTFSSSVHCQNSKFY